MSHESRESTPFLPFETSLDSENTPDFDTDGQDPQTQVLQLLQQMVVNQQRQTELLEEMNRQLHSAQRQKANELAQWKQANPKLARDCRNAAEVLSQVQTEFLRSLTEEVEDNAEGLTESEFVLSEFVDRFGPRMAHLNGVLQILSQLSAAGVVPKAHKR